MVTHGTILPAGPSFMEQSRDSGGSKGERRVPSRIDDSGFWRRGAMEAQRRVRVLCCMRSEEEPFGAMVASMANLARGFTLV
jgi:hypothetical protein